MLSLSYIKQNLEVCFLSPKYQKYKCVLKDVIYMYEVTKNNLKLAFPYLLYQSIIQ